MMCAANKGRVEVVAPLVDGGADVDFQTEVWWP